MCVCVCIFLSMYLKKSLKRRVQAPKKGRRTQPFCPHWQQQHRANNGRRVINRQLTGRNEHGELYIEGQSKTDRERNQILLSENRVERAEKNNEKQGQRSEFFKFFAEFFRRRDANWKRSALLQESERRVKQWSYVLLPRTRQSCWHHLKTSVKQR
jgi:hypothetical protein